MVRLIQNREEHPDNQAENPEEIPQEKMVFTGGEAEEAKIKNLESKKPVLAIDTGGATIRIYDKNNIVYKQYSGTDVRYSLLGKEAADFVIQEEISRHEQSLPEDQRVLGVYDQEKAMKRGLVEKGFIDPNSEAAESKGHAKQSAKIELKEDIISRLKEASELINSVN